MDEWLRQTWKKSKFPPMRGFGLFLTIFLALLGLVSLISDVGFAPEIQNYRALILKIAAVFALLGAVSWLYYQMYRELADSKKLIGQLQDENSNLKQELERTAQELESAYDLMKQYRAETQENFISRLEQFAQFCIMRDKWAKKGAKVEWLRTEKATTVGGEDESWLAEHVIVIINLGTQDGVMEEMRFIVEDPTDSHQYGVIGVQKVLKAGAHCRILEMLDTAFWNEAIRAVEEGRTFVSDTLAGNRIVPASSLRQISPESAKELLQWLSYIRTVEL